MEEYWKDGKRVNIKAIYQDGRVGQVVILGYVGFGDNPDLEKWPFAKYDQPSTFKIVKKIEGKDGYYVFEDEDGNQITAKDDLFGASISYLYDANEWLAFEAGRIKEKLRRKEAKIQHLESQKDLLKSILIAQGVRVISEVQAKELGISG